MRILAIENSTPTGSVVLWCDGEIEFGQTFTAARGRSSALFGALGDVLKIAPVLDRIAVGTGPGSYNGIRVALAAGKGIQMARNAHFVALSSALCLEESEYAWFGDARASQFHFSHVADGKFLQQPKLLTRDELQTAFTSLSCPAFSDATHEGISAHTVAHPSAKILATLAASAPHCDAMPEPLYLKPPHVTVPRS